MSATASLKPLLKSILMVVGGYYGLKMVKYFIWRAKINAAVPGPSWEGPSIMALYRAGLGDFWGINPKLFATLHAKYGPVVKFWLLGELYMSFADVRDIFEVNKLAKGRPVLTELLLPFLGKKNLLFQPTGHDEGAFVKQLRLRYGKMVSDKEALRSVHEVTVRTLAERTSHWDGGAPIDAFNELKTILYDIMGIALFGGQWSDTEVGSRLLKVHRFCIERSATVGISFLARPSFSSLLAIPSDARKFKAATREFQAICKGMLDSRLAEINADPAKWEDDTSALTMLLKDKAADGSKFFDEDLATATCAGFINGAYDTTHNTTFWALWHLATHPDIQSKLQAEVDSSVGRGEFTMEDCREFKLMHAFLLESNRMRTTVPVGMRCSFSKDLTINGYPVPKGVTLMPIWNEAAKDPKYFGDNPDRFIPERFIGDTDAAKKARSSFHGFGTHARMCVGFKFAEAELKCIFTFLLQRYTVELADKSITDPAMLLESGVHTPMEKFRFIFKKR